jgi:hypothetical protein
VIYFVVPEQIISFVQFGQTDFQLKKKKGFLVGKDGNEIHCCVYERKIFDFKGQTIVIGSGNELKENGKFSITCMYNLFWRGMFPVVKGSFVEPTRLQTYINCSRWLPMLHNMINYRLQYSHLFTQYCL